MLTQASAKTSSLQRIHRHIDEVLEGINPLLKASNGITVRRVANLSDVLMKDNDKIDAPHYFALFVKDLSDTDVGESLISFFFGYSSWDGRCMFVDELPEGKDGDEKLYLQILAKISIRLGSPRVTWKRTGTPKWYAKYSQNPPEIIDEAVVLRMGKHAMKLYTGGLQETNSADGSKQALDRSLVESLVNECLVTGSSVNSNFRLRLVVENNEEDANAMASLVRGLAVYVKEPLEAIRCTAKDYLQDGQGSNPFYYCFLIEHNEKETHKTSTCGIAIVYFGHYMKEGRFLYLEDLYVEEAFRKQGAGSLALQSLTAIGLRLQCESFYWIALAWNRPALDLYKKIGADVQPGLCLHRYTDKKLAEFAQDFNSSLVE